jgi:quinol monooxygenase YgiN
MWQVEEIVQTICDSVYEKEPGALKYQWFRAGGTEKPLIVVWET